MRQKLDAWPRGDIWLHRLRQVGDAANCGTRIVRRDAMGTLSAVAQQKRPLELADYYRLESVRRSADLPDGRQVAFVRSVIVESDNTRQTEIWLAPTDGSAPATRLTTPAFNASAPRWSPDGALLAFTSRRRVPGAGERGRPRSGSCEWIGPAARRSRSRASTGHPCSAPTTSGLRSQGARRPTRSHAPATEFERKIEERFKGRDLRLDELPLRRPRLPARPARSGSDAVRGRSYVVPREGGAPRRVTSIGVDVQEFAWRPDSQAIAFIANALAARRIRLRALGRLVHGLPSGGAPRRITDDGYDHDCRGLVARRRALVLPPAVWASTR